MTPFDIRDVSDQEDEMIRKVYNYERKWIKLGPQNYIMPGAYRDFAEKVYNMEVRDDDIWVVSYPRSGTTLTQEMTWLLCNQLNFKAAKLIPLTERFPFMEETMIVPEKIQSFVERQAALEIIAELPSPRFIKTHIPFSILPPTLFTKNTKILYVARNPKDVVSSYFQLELMFRYFKDDFKSFSDLFWNDLLKYSPHTDHVLEAWKRKDHPNLLFLFYEDMRKDLISVLKRAAKFLNQAYTDEQLQSLADHLHIDKMKKSKAVNWSLNREYMKAIFGEKSGFNDFIRKGEVGGWRKIFDQDMMEQADEYIKKKLNNIDFKYLE